MFASLASTQNKLRRGPKSCWGLTFPLGQPGREKEGPGVSIQARILSGRAGSKVP